MFFKIERWYTMKITGYKLREALKMAQLELTTIATQFEESLFRFEGEEKTTPRDIIDRVNKLETDIAKLQTAQCLYNLGVNVTIFGCEVTLQEAIKRVGGAGRIAKMWKIAAQGNKVDRWAVAQQMSRKTDDIMAESTVSKVEALEETKSAEKYASTLRNAIAIGNTTERDCTGSDIEGVIGGLI